MGNPSGFDHTLNEGIVSSIRTSEGYGKLLQISAPLAPGSSGSPVVNDNGYVVGIVAAQAVKQNSIVFCVPTERIQAIPEMTSQPLSQFSRTQTKALVKKLLNHFEFDPQKVTHLTPEAMLDQGRILLGKDQFSQAIPFLLGLLTADADNFEAWLWLFTASKALNNEMAAPALAQAARLNSEVQTREGIVKWLDIGFNEQSALSSVRVLYSSSLLYRSTNGEFPSSLKALQEDLIIDPDLASGHRRGYRFEYHRIVGNGGRYTFVVLAYPLKPGVTGYRSFYMGEIGKIRYEINSQPGPKSTLFIDATVSPNNTRAGESLSRN